MEFTTKRDFAKLDSTTLFALNLYNESESEGQKGREAVAEVVMNRAKDKKEFIKPVILESKQFSWLNESKVTGKIPPVFTRRTKKFLENKSIATPYLQIVNNFFSGRKTNHTQGATHYLNEVETKRIRGGSLPSWFYNLENRITIGRHTFGKGYFGVTNALKQFASIVEQNGTTFFLSTIAVLSFGAWYLKKESKNARS
jgi:hypothetical protein